MHCILCTKAKHQIRRKTRYAVPEEIPAQAKESAWSNTTCISNTWEIWCGSWMINCSLSMIVILLDFQLAGNPWTVNWTSIWSKSHQLYFNRKLPTASYTDESASVCGVSVSYSHITESAWGLDLAHLCVCVGQLQRFITAPPTHRRLSACVGVLCAPPWC